MNYKINIITRDQIPSNIYLCYGTNKDWELIHSFEFENGLRFIIGSHYPISSPTLIIEDMQQELDLILNIDNPCDLQVYYYNNFYGFMKFLMKFHKNP